MRTRRDFLCGVASVAVTMAARPPAAAQRRRAAADPSFMYVGSFTSQGRGDGEGLSVYRMEDAPARRSASRKGGSSTSEGGTKTWTRVQLLTDLADPSFLAINREGTFLYSSHGGGTQATSYRIDQATGQITIVNQQPTHGENGTHLAIDGSGRFLTIANYASGHLAVLRIEEDGALGPLSDMVALTGKPGPHRTQQTSSHPHHAPFDRTGRFIVVPDKGFDKVFVFRLDTATGKLVPGTPSSVDSRSGAAPRHVDFHPTRPYAYVINELDSTMTTYHYDPDKGVLKPLQVHTTLPPSYTGNNTGAEVVVSPDGRFVYGSNRGHDSIAIFSVDQASGLLTAVGWEPTQGRTPRFFCLDPTGAHLYAANQSTGSVVIFRVDRTTGKLTATGQVLKVRNPSTIVFR